MKTLICLITFLMASVSQGAFLELQTDKETYSVGESAVLVAHISTTPANPNYESYIEAKFDDETIETVKITENEAVSLPAQFLESGSFEWSVSLYVQNVHRSKKYQATILFYTNQITENRTLLETETDPNKIALLNASIARAERVIVITQGKLDKGRVLVEERNLTVTVQAKKLFESESPAILVESNHPSHIFAVGEVATFTTTVIATPEKQELVVRAKIDLEAVGVVKLTDDEFKTDSATFVLADVGTHNYQVNVYIRPQFRSDSLRVAIIKAQSMRAEYNALYEQTDDPNLKAYYAKKRDDMHRVVSAFYSILEEMLILYGSKDYQFSVN